MKDLSPKKKELEPIEVASIDEIRALQLDKLKWSVHHAYNNVAFYENRYDEVGVHPGDLKHLEDIKLFPFTTKEDLRNNYPFNMFAHKLKDIARIHASSGTTGKTESRRSAPYARSEECPSLPAPSAGFQTYLSLLLRV